MKKKRAKGKRVLKLSPESQESRDEGPRLIPFSDAVMKDAIPANRLGHYLDLADTALGQKRKK
jgi:hypothetical protein